MPALILELANFIHENAGSLGGAYLEHTHEAQVAGINELIRSDEPDKAESILSLLDLHRGHLCLGKGRAGASAPHAGQTSSTPRWSQINRFFEHHYTRAPPLCTRTYVTHEHQQNNTSPGATRIHASRVGKRRT